MKTIVTKKNQAGTKTITVYGTDLTDVQRVARLQGMKEVRSGETKYAYVPCFYIDLQEENMGW